MTTIYTVMKGSTENNRSELLSAWTDKDHAEKVAELVRERSPEGVTAWIVTTPLDEEFAKSGHGAMPVFDASYDMERHGDEVLPELIEFSNYRWVTKSVTHYVDRTLRGKVAMARGVTHLSEAVFHIERVIEEEAR